MVISSLPPSGVAGFPLAYSYPRQTRSGYMERRGFCDTPYVRTTEQGFDFGSGQGPAARLGSGCNVVLLTGCGTYALGAPEGVERCLFGGGGMKNRIAIWAP